MSRKGIITTYEGRKNAPFGKYQFPPNLEVLNLISILRFQIHQSGG